MPLLTLHRYFLADHWHWPPDSLHSISVRERFELVDIKLDALQKERDKRDNKDK